MQAKNLPKTKFRPAISLVHEDARGEMYSISLPGDRELMLLHSHAGALRGGHSHDVAEQVMVLDGLMRYRKHRAEFTDTSGSESTSEELLREGDTSYNAAGRDHMGEFFQDTWLVEWKIGTTKTGWKNTNYAPWRKEVDANAR